MLAAVRDHLIRGSTLERVDFVLYDRHAREVFERTMAAMPD
jgi:hypothetical protein